MPEYNNFDNLDDIQNAASGGLGEGNPVLPHQDIADYLVSEWGTMANIVTDISQIPVDATSRSRDFYSVAELEDYLMQGKLLVADDASQTGYTPATFVHGYVNYSPEGDDCWLTIYIERDS